MPSTHIPKSISGFRRWAFWRRGLRIDSARDGRLPTSERAVWTPLDPQQQQEHANQLAKKHCLLGAAPCNLLLERMEANADFLDQTICRTVDLDAEGCLSGEAAEWLIENETQIREQVRAVRRGVGRRPRPEFPHVAGDTGDHTPRLYELAWELATHLDGPLDQERVEAFVAAYQEAAILTLSELWSLGDMLRLALIEALARLARQVIGNERTTPSPLDGIRNAISSLHALEDVSWKEIVESQSMVERILRDDPANAYARMDFDSRDYCRRAVEEIAQGTTLSEEQVASAALEFARSACTIATDASALPQALEKHKQAHVGYYLVDLGRPLLENRVGYHPSGRDALEHFVLRWPLVCYLAAIAAVWVMGIGTAVTLAICGGLLENATPPACLILLFVFSVASTHFSVNLVNWLASLLLPPRPVLRLDFSKGIPDACQSLVAVPAMLTDAKAVLALVRQLEVRYLANRDEHLLFLLLTDFPDAKEPTLPGDYQLLRLACSEIERLNDRYCKDYPSIFYLLHRKRKWNSQEGVWMGEERKRGKLTDLNRLVRTGDASAFHVTRGDLGRLSSVRYVITLDADTRLPPDAARQLVGCMAHPLNRPCIDPATGLVVEGYAVLQPRITVSISEAHRSPFGRLLAGDAGGDPYTRHASNIYQDAFGQGSFIGKGIYDVTAFEAALDGRFPDNRILSHDLIEGCFARSGSANDVELFEGVPSRVLSDMSRRHRWIRGDWQIASWMLPRTTSTQGAIANPLPPLARWKIFDNLRRSMTPIFLALFVIVGCTLAPVMTWLWMTLAAFLLLGPLLAGSLLAFVRRPEEKPRMLHLKDQWQTLLDALLFETVGWCILPYSAHCHLDAVLRALYRLFVSRCHLLEWTTASEAEARSGGSCRDHYEILWICPVLGIALICWLTVTAPWTLLYAGPALLGWLLGPAIAWRISQSTRGETSVLDAAEASEVGRWVRQTWHFFETHVNQHGLPPDHVQEHPTPAVARLTSPTNIGMGLLADLAAYDFGYLSADGLLDRTSRTLQTMARLEKYRGHFYNWYDIETLQVVEPRYISSVDSGNLWGSLLVLRTGLEELRDRAIVPLRVFQGLQDTLEVIINSNPSSSLPASTEALKSCLARLSSECAASPPAGARRTLARLRRISGLATRLLSRIPSHDRSMRQWVRALRRQCAAGHRELSVLVFWRSMGRNTPPALRRILVPIQEWCEELDKGCTLQQLLQTAEKVAAHIDRRLAKAVCVPVNNRATGQAVETLTRLRDRARNTAATVRKQLQNISSLTDLIQRMCEMDFGFLFDPRRKALAVGYDVTRQKRDKSHYDLIASESRLTSFLAISHGQIPKDHWLALGRMATLVGGRFGLLSWSGSMFEYLMPMLIMPTYPGTILKTACMAAVRGQIGYGRHRQMPWGISESCHHRIAPDLRYHYQAFGVPDLSLSPSLADHPVVAPYASALAMMVEPNLAAANLAQIERLGGLSHYGFYDAIDYAATDPRSKTSPALCRIVMAHHSGMALLAMAHSLLGDVMQRRFMADPRCEAYDTLLQERVPRAVRLADRPTQTVRGRKKKPKPPRSYFRYVKTPSPPSSSTTLVPQGA